MNTQSFRSALRALALVMTAAQLAGCAVPFPTYSASTDNITSLRNVNKRLELGEFSGASTSVSCRLQPISPEGGRTFAQYIRGAWNDELVMAGVSGSGSKSKVLLTLKHVDVDCGMSSASWTFEVEVAVNGQAPFNVRTQRNFDGNFLGTVVLQRAYQSYVPSVQQLIAEVIAHPKFKAGIGV
jgi:hypothetical protein